MKPKVLQKILGHATLEITMNLYAHVLPQLQVDEMALLEEEMNKIDDMGDSIVNEQYNKQKMKESKIIHFEAI